MSTIIGNTEYKSIKEKAYINGTQENIMQLAAELDKEGITYSGLVSDYRSAITVEAADRARTLEIMKGILNAAKETTPAENAEKNVIGNAEFRYIPNKRYVRGETEVMLRIADRLTAENISFSGRIKGDTATLTVSGEETQALVKKYFAEEKNRVENIQSAYFLALASDTFEDGYYISEVNVNTGEEIAQHRSQFGDISMFISVDSAVRYAEGAGVTLSNTDEQLSEWRRIEIEAEKEKDRQLNLFRSREIMKRLPMISENDYEEQFVLRENSIDWIYFNPDGANGEGQFVVTTLYADDILNAYIARADTDEYNSQSAFIEVIENGKQTIINADTEEFERYALSFINSRNKDNVIVSAPVVSGNGYDKDFQKIINTLESIFDEVSSYKENHITDISDHITVEGHMGMWYVIDSEEIEGKKLFLLEHEEYGDEAANIIIDENKNLVMEDVYNGFDDYRDSLEYNDDKQYIGRDLAVEMWENGFTVFMNDRNNALSNNSDDPNMFDLFTEEKNNTFYAFSNDIVQQRLLDDIVTLLDNLDSAARLESEEQGKEVGNVADYAKDMYEDGECAYKWRDGLTEWQHISASIRSGNTEYIYAWLRDLQFELPYLKDNRNFSVTSALEHLNNYEKQYTDKFLSVDELKKGTRFAYDNKNWEVAHVNNNVLALKNLDSDTQMSSVIIENWQNVVTRNKVEFIAEKEKSPVGNYVPDESLPLSKQLYDLAKIELTNYENSLDTAEKAKAAAYELSVKRDILSYIEYDLAADITDSDVENACRRLISTGYPLDSFYQDWLKNEYDNRMEAIRMTAEDTFRKENAQIDISPVGNTEKNLEFTVITFEDGSVYVEAGRIDDNNVNGTAAYADMMKNNFDIDKMEDLDENIKVEYAVYHTGDGEAVMSTEEELAEIRNNLDDFIGDKDPVLAVDSYLYPWKNVDDILYGLDELWKERHNTDPQISDDSGSFYHLLPENLNHTGQSGDVRYYDTYSSVQLIKLKNSEWLHPVDAAVELNRRGVDLNDVEMLNVNMIDEYGHFYQRDITPEQFAVYEKRIEGDLKGYDNILRKYRQERERIEKARQESIEKARETAHNAGLPFREAYADENEEDFNPYVFDGTMSSEDYELMHKLMREDSFEIYQVKSGEEYRNKRFTELSALNSAPNIADYDLVYSGKLSEQDITDQSRDEILESVFAKFNNDRPEDFKGHSLSVSDIVVLHKNGEDTAHYVDDIGFKDIPEFFITIEERFARETLTNNLALIAKNQLASDELDELAENLFNFKNNNTVPIGNWVMGRDLDAITFGRLMADYSDSKDIRAELAKHIYNNYGKEGYIETFESEKPDFHVTSSRDDNGMTFSTDGGFSISYTWEELGEALINTARAEYDRHQRIEKEYEQFLAENKEFFTLFDNKKDIPVIIKNSAEFDYYRTAEHGYTNLRLHFKEHEGYLLQADNAENESVTIHNYTLVNGETVLGMMNGVNLTYDRETILRMIEKENSEQEKSNADISANSPVGKTMLKEGDLITLADRQGVWKVSAVTDIQIEFENTDPNSPEKSFSHIDFGQRREHLQESLQYTLVSERDEIRIDKATNSPVGTDEIPDKIKYETFGGGSMYFRDEQMNDLAEISADGIKYYAELSENDKKKVADRAKELLNIGENRPYQVITYDGNAGADEKEDFITLEEAQKSAREYLENNYDGMGTSAWEGYAIYNKDTQTIEETSGYFPSEIIFSNDVLIKNGIIPHFTEKEPSPVGNNETLEKAKQLISNFCDREYSSTGDFSDLHNVSIAYTTLTDDEFPIQVTADLIDFKLIFELNGQKYNEEQYNSLEELIEYELSNLDFDELVYVPDRVLEKYISGGEPTDLMSEFSEAIEENLKTVTNQYNSFLLVQDVVYSLRDLRDGYADNYDWRNYAEAFKTVLDSNVNTDVALPLYKSGADDILLAAAEKRVISADDIAKALSNLELVLQNSHLLKNPEEKVEQISFFSSTPNRTSSDEIGYSSASEPTQDKGTSPVGNNPQEEKTEKKTAVDYTITDKNYGTEGGAKTRFANNVEAIKLLKTIEKENRTATPEEQEVLAKYVGWGGIANAFDSRKSDWNKEYNELKNLLTDEEYRAARASTMNAHYTSPTVINAIYSGLKNLGFKDGKILEPAMGIGNFFGAMPDSIHNNSELHGVELDSITGRIAQKLYPSANIQVKGYEDTGFENGSFDVAVGNVPFGSYKLNDKDYNKQNFLIHDYFFAKTLDKVRAGGIVAFVTSKGTLDKESPEVRKYLAERAELLGAIRLPNNAFKSNAGTEVTSDIIFLQKRERPISIEENPPEWIYKDMLPNGIAVNKYFADHPEMILGEMVEGNKLYGNQTDASMCVPIEGANLEEQLAAAIKNITGEYKAAEKEIVENSPVGNTDEIPCPPNAPKYSFIVQNDTLYYHKSADTMEKYKAPEKSIEKIKAMVQLRDSVHKLLDLQLDNINGRLDTAITEAQAALNRQYDDFSAKYGLISNAENKMLFRNDNSYHIIKSLEKLDKDGNFIGKADIFSKITINPKVIVDHCDNAQDALILSLSEKMCVNLEYMSILTGKSEEELIAELGDKIYQNPQKFMRWESADEYLTGNIRSKLAAAEAAGLTRNAEALKAVMPERIEAADIDVKLGSAWIDPDYIRQFIVETLKPDYITSKNIEVTYMPATDRWKVDGYKSAYSNTLANETYGTYDMNAYEIIEATLNMQKAEIKERVKDEYGNDLRDSKGRYVYEVNQKKTMIAQSKQDELKRMFSDWIFSDPDRREKLVDVYNEKFNSVRLREYDGSHLNFVGMSSLITLKNHQKNAVARGLYSNGNTLLAHEVGAGKTFEMIAIAMEGKRLGLHNKSLITAPNGLTEQWGNAFRTLYPNANVLVATEKDFQKENRRDLFAKIATGDWDAVVIGHSQFDMIHLSRERELDVLHSELDILEEALREIDDGGKKSFSVKQIEKSIRMYEDKIEKLLAKAPEDDMLCFEKLGIDKIFVDESQAYKNLDTPTKMRNVSGIGSGGSGRAMQLLMKCKYLDEVTGSKGTVFASGTPISNSMSEMYTLMRYLQADKLAELGINSFDRWASIFGETISSMELSPEGNGKYQMKTRFARFQNLPELMNIFKECADIKTADTLNLDRPDFEMHNVNVPATAIQAMMIKELGERAKVIRTGKVDPTEDNMCKITVDGRKIGLDQRCMNPNLPDDPKSKVNVCINNVFDIWQRTAEEKSTQLIFCDLATPQPTLNENTYTVFRKNEKGGYSDVYSAKLGEKDTAEKIMKKLNGKKPPKNYEAGDVSNGDIILLKRVNYEEETAYNTAFEVVDGKLTEISPETWEKLKHTPVEDFESERRFCVYDDIKQKLIAKGVPEKEIAFIHDVDKAEDKQRLYDKMNKGEIRVLIGSTFKCGAGMNAQERMIALHDLDAPMRPSDMEQRHGRIIRQGNTNSKVDIYRYTTDKTFDAYLYQMLENKQRFISQIMTDKSPVRSCEDVDEVALDYAEVKALCAGNPLIREKIDLETDITKLNVLKSAFLSQKYSLQDKAYKSLPEHRKHTERYIGQLKADIETVQSVKPLVNEDDKKYYPVTVGGREYHDKEKAGQAIRNAIIGSSELTEKKQCHIGSYRGFEMTAFLDTKWEGHTVIKINLKGACDHSCEINMNNDVKASGNIVRLDNVINGMELELQKQEDKLQSLNADIKEAEIAAKAVFPQEQELTEKEKRLAEVNTLLADTEVQVDNSMELYAALVEICPELETYSNFDCKYEKGKDSGIEPLIVQRFEDTVLIAHTYVQNGETMYDPAIEFSFDTQNHRAQALSYKLSGMGIYQDFRDGNLPDQKADVEEMALGVMFENIKAYGYERTKFNAEDNREAEKEIRDDSAR